MGTMNLRELAEAAREAPRVVAILRTGEIVTEPPAEDSEKALMDRRPVLIVAKALTDRRKNGKQRDDFAQLVAYLISNAGALLDVVDAARTYRDVEESEPIENDALRGPWESAADEAACQLDAALDRLEADDASR